MLSTRKFMSLKKNTLWNLIGSSLPLLAAAAFIPYCLRQLGNEAFGVLTLIWALIGYFSLFDFGAGRALTYEVAQLRATQKTDVIGHKIIAGLVLTSLTGAFGTIVMLLLAPSLSHDWLKISPLWQEDALRAFQIAALGVIPTAITSGLRGAMEGLERFPESNLNKIFLGFCMFSLPALSIFVNGNSLSNIALYLVIARLLVVLIGIFQLRHYLPLRLTSLNTIPASTTSLSLQMRGLMTYGFWVTISGIISPLMVYGDRFFVSAIVGADQLSMYAIPQEGLMRLLIVPMAVCSALLPLMTTIKTPDELAEVYQKNYRRMGKLMLTLCLLTALLAYPALSIWLSKDFAAKALPITLILTVGTFLNAVALIPYTLLHARGKTKLTAQFHLFEFVLYIAVLYVLSNQFGLIGAAMAWVIRVTIDFLLLHNTVRRMFENKLA